MRNVLLYLCPIVCHVSGFSAIHVWDRWGAVFKILRVRGRFSGLFFVLPLGRVVPRVSRQTFAFMLPSSHQVKAAEVYVSTGCPQSRRRF